MNFLREIVFSHKDIGTIKEAREHKLTSFSRCEECKALLRESTAYRAK